MIKMVFIQSITAEKACLQERPTGREANSPSIDGSCS